MLIHSYDSVTGQYINSGLADPDPRNPGRWLEPSFTTTQALPERGRYQWPFFDKKAGTWKLLPDFTGILLYRTADGEAAEVTLKGISLAEAGLTTEPRPDNVHTWQEGEWKPDPVLVARQLRETAMAEFNQRMVVGQSKTMGKADAYSMGIMTPEEIADYRAWTKYLMALTRVVNGPDFPEARNWPAEPDAAAVAAELELALAEKAQKEMLDAQAKAEEAGRQSEVERIAAEQAAAAAAGGDTPEAEA